MFHCRYSIEPFGANASLAAQLNLNSLSKRHSPAHLTVVAQRESIPPCHAARESERLRNEQQIERAVARTSERKHEAIVPVQQHRVYVLSTRVSVSLRKRAPD